MSEDFKDSETAGAGNADDPVSASVGGFFDSLIADFSLDAADVPKKEKKPEREFHIVTDDEPVVEIVDCFEESSLSTANEAASAHMHSSASDEDIIVIYDAEADDSGNGGEYNDDRDVPDEYEYEDEYGQDTALRHYKDVGTKKSSFIAGILPVKGDSVFEAVRKIFFLTAVTVFVVSGCMLISTLVQSKRALDDKKKIDEMFSEPVHTTIVTNEAGEEIIETIPLTPEEEEERNFSIMQYFKEQNPDVIGYIELDGCDIHLPVVQTDDNEYYLTHTFYNGVNKCGSIFMDYRCTVSRDRFSPNLVLYGHNQQDGTMFGNLKLYKNDIAFYEENPMIRFRTDYGVGDYVIFAYFVTNALERQDSEVFHYQDYIETLETPSTFAWYMYQIQKRSQIIAPVDVVCGDQLLLLSTCSNEFSDSRFVVVARKLREGETASSFDFSATVVNDGFNSLHTTTEETSAETTTEETAETTAVTEPPVSETEEEITETVPVTEEELPEETEQTESKNAVLSDLMSRTETSPETTEETTSETAPAPEETTAEETSSKKKKTEAETEAPEETSVKETKKTRAPKSETTAAPETEQSKKTKASSEETTAAETEPVTESETEEETTAAPTETSKAESANPYTGPP